MKNLTSKKRKSVRPSAAKGKRPTGKESIDKKLWAAADRLRKNIDAAEYKHIVLGLIFLKYISDSFEALYKKLQRKERADPEDPDEYKAKNIFFVPSSARWSHLRKRARRPEIGHDLDQALDAIERENPSLKNVLPKNYAKTNIDPLNLGQLIDEFSNIDIEEAKGRSQDILGHVFEYFLGQFGLAEGRKGGQFYTPRSVVKLLVEMLQPDKGRVFDPCCGTGGMFVQSEKFVRERQGRIGDISVFGQESNRTTWRLAKMNLAVRGIDSSQVKWNSEGSFLKNAHPDKKMDCVIANPPFNDSEWGGARMRGDARWRYGEPPAGNANFAWIQHFIYHLKPPAPGRAGGRAGFVMAKGSLTSKSSNEDKIRKNMVEARLTDCIVNLPAKLFLNTQIPASLWFVSRKEAAEAGKLSKPAVLKRKKTASLSAKNDHVLFIDARNLGVLINRRNRILSDKDIQKIAGTYRAWQNYSGKYKDEPGFCASVSIERIRALDYILSPGRYVGLPEEEEEFDFPVRFAELKNRLEGQMKEEVRLNKRILKNLSRIEY